MKQMPEVAKGMNAAKKYVASRTLEPKWQNTQLLDGELVAAVRALKKKESAVILGSGSIVQQLGEAGLIDEYQFVVVPIALGGGRTLFAGTANLRLEEHRAFPSGKVALTYTVARR